MVEEKLEVIKNGEYKNIYLKPNKNGAKGITPDNYIIVEKVYAEGYENTGKFGKYYACKVIHNNEEVGFLLNEKEHEAFKGLGGEGDKLKISLWEETIVNKRTMAKMIVNRLRFEPV